MSATSEYEPAARQDYGPTTSSENVYEHVLDHKLADMNVQSVRTPVLRAVPLSPTEGDPEPDSTNPESIIQSVHKVDKEVEYHIAEKRCDTDMSVDSLSGLVRIEEAIDNVGRIAYPILQEADDSNDGNYVENATTLIQAPLNTAIVQNVTKLPQNFTINVDAAVGNITSIQNVQDVSGNQTLWLPTILATSAPTNDTKTDDDRSQAGVSQIIITSESYVNDSNQTGRRANIVTETNFISRPKTSKVQILSNISIPKNPSYNQQYITGKEIASVYGTQNHVYKLSNSVLSAKPQKNQSLIGCSTMSSNVVNNSPIKNVPYSHTFTKSTNLNKTLNKVNNGANLNAMVAASSGNTQCHILSRVVSGPNKMSVHSGRKSVNTFKGSKNSGQVSNQKNQSRPIKIIQQTSLDYSANKSEGKSWPVASVTYKSTQPSYGVVDSNASKIIQKVGSPTHKSQPMSLSKFPSKGERLVLQSPCGPVLLSTAPISTSLPKGPHYVQSGSTPNLRYVQTYGSSDNQISSVSQVSANQQLTAQILQSLSQPKLLLQPSPTPVNHNITSLPPPPEEPIETKPVHQKRIVVGDKTTLLTEDDIIGMEERPNLSEELRRYSFQPLAFVMLDHTYAQPAQKQPVATPPTTPVSTAPPPVIVSPPITTAPMSPLKRNSPVIMSTASYDMPSTVPTSIAGTPTPVSSIQMTPMTYKPQAPPPPDDDAASVISSIDGDRRQANRGGSDTETAPEGEEEGKTRCICDFTHDDGYMICCDRCGEWQHVDCMGIDRQNIPDAYMCELCLPRPIDRRHARAIQLRKREELSALGASDSDSSEGGRAGTGQKRKRLLTVTTYTNTSGSCVTTYNSTVPVLPPLPQPSLALPKRGPKRPKKPEVVRKSGKRKLTEKRVKRKKELLLSRSKYSSSLSNQSHFQDSYELAVTNHYSPELRAKIMKYSNKLGNTPNMAYAMNAHLCTTVPHAGGKILIATKDLKENTPVIELRGKYMLSNQHRPQLQNSARAGSQKPGPFVFFYRLPKDNTQICIDTRTYGNEARFVRRSCKPNAELQHCIVKGTLHVYLVSIGVVQANTEITVGHDSDGSKQPCACGNPKHCKVNGLNTLPPRKSVDYPPREKRSRNRCFSSSSPVSPPLTPAVTTPLKEYAPHLPLVKSEKKSPMQIKHEYPPLSPVKSAVMALNFDEPPPPEPEPIEDVKPEIDLIAKEEMKPEDIDELDYCKVEPPVEKFEESVKEEPIIPQEVEEPILEKPKPLTPEKKEETKEVKQESEDTYSDDEKPDKPVKEKVEEKKPKEEPERKEIKELKELRELKKELKELKEPKLEDDRPATREFTAKSACHDRSSRSSRTTCVNQDSLDDKTDDSQDKIQTSSKEKDKRKMTREERKMEAIMKAIERMEKAEQRKQEVKERQKRRESDPHPNANDKDDDEEIHNTSKKRKKRKGRARTTSQSNRRRLNSADSDMVTSGDEAPHTPLSPPRALPPHRRDSAIPPPDNDRNDGVNEEIGLSSACLLVEAAVGSVESAFKLPKTKKTMATEWIGRSPERTPSPYRSPYRHALVSAPSLESLVKVASTMIGDLSGGQDIDHEDDTRASPPRTPGRDRNRPPKKAKRITRSTPPAEVVEVVQPVIPQHSAKKRWLRQAISEESDSPSADVFVSESPPNEMVTPLKKRRLARESLSCEQNTIVPCNDETSPILTSEDSPVKDDNQAMSRQYKVRNIMDSIYGRDRTRSDSGQGSDDQCNMDNEVLNMNIKGPHDSENIRRIIGVPTPEDEIPPEIIPKPEDKSNNNNVELEESNYNKVVPMEIDTTIPAQPKIQESLDVNNIDPKGIESPNDKLNSCQSADTSGNSSPQRDEMDDIQKKIHSFHTENIQILKSRNKKPPKEKRKKVNLNFDLNMVDDQISIQLRTEDTNSKAIEVNGDIHDDMSNSVHDDVKLHVSPENIPLPPVESIPILAPENIPLPEEPSPMPVVPPPETIPLPEEPMKPVKILRPVSPVVEKPRENSEKPFTIDRPSVLENSTLPFSSRFSSTGLFSGIFSNMSQPYLDSSINENVPSMSIIKSAIDRTTILDSSLFEKDSITPADELKNVQDILTRVNNMDSNNSVILSGVLSSSNKSSLLAPSPKPVSKPYCPRTNDPRLNPPPVEKPKPVRRKLSITEYRKRHKGVAGGEEGGGGDASEAGDGVPGEGGVEWSSESSGAGSLSPQRLDAAAAAAADELEQRLHRELTASHMPKGVFDAQPTASERQRENLSSRLRREFGLALPDDEEARPPTENTGMDDWTHKSDMGNNITCVGQTGLVIGGGIAPLAPTGTISACSSNSTFFTRHDGVNGVVGYSPDTSNCDIKHFDQIGYSTSYGHKGPKGLKWGRRGV
ncbi:SET domain-containing protein upSET isoform X2 [Anticarsia gemmatalis]|uniref:SET domain-containing protein upSET isoform X2 n=1 Tax=Anticarsia gemmatalis TaxID=129554 RepID=UPI003F76B30F